MPPKNPSLIQLEKDMDYVLSKTKKLSDWKLICDTKAETAESTKKRIFNYIKLAVVAIIGIGTIAVMYFK